MGRIPEKIKIHYMTLLIYQFSFKNSQRGTSPNSRPPILAERKAHHRYLSLNNTHYYGWHQGEQTEEIHFGVGILFPQNLLCLCSIGCSMFEWIQLQYVYLTTGRVQVYVNRAMMPLPMIRGFYLIFHLLSRTL